MAKPKIKGKPSIKGKPKKTPLQEEYEKQYLRIVRSIKEAEKRGFVFPESVYPKKLKNPKISSVANLKDISIKDFYSKRRAYYIDPQTGEMMSAKAGRKLEQTRAAQKAAETRAKNKGEEGVKDDYPREGLEVVERVIEMIENFVPCGTPMQQDRMARHKEALRSWINAHTQSEKGKMDLARAFQGRAQEASRLTDKALSGYYEDLVYCITMFATWVKGSALTVQESKYFESEISEFFYDK